KARRPIGVFCQERPFFPGLVPAILFTEVLPMMKRLLSTGLAAVGLFAFAPNAHAGLDSCGDINIEANASCTVEVEGGCTAHCTPVSFEAACHGSLQASCDGECSANVEASCTGSCETDCQANCEADPGHFDCSADCEA